MARGLYRHAPQPQRWLPKLIPPVEPVTTESSFTADAVLFRTTSGSFIADAVVFRVTSASFTADAIVFQTQTASFTADAVLTRTVSSSFTADAIAFRATTSSFTADAIILRTYICSGSGAGGIFDSGIFDSGIFDTGGGCGLTVDAVIVSVPDPPFVPKSNITARGIWRSAPRISPQRGPSKRTNYTAARVSQVATEVLTKADNPAARLSQLAVEVLVAVEYRSNRPANITALGIFRPSKRIAPQSLPNRLPFEGVFTFEGSFTADAVTLREQAGSFTADAITRSTVSSSFTADAVISRTVSSSFTADAILLRTQTGSLTADGVLLRAQSASFTADAIAFRTQSGSFTEDAMVRRTVTGFFTADAVIPGGAVTTEGSFTADAIVRRERTGSFSADAIIKATRSFSFTADGVILRTQSASFFADAIVRRETSGSFVGDAVLRATRSASFSANAVIFRTTTATFTANAVVMPTFTANAVIRRIETFSFTADAFITTPGFGVFTLDAVIAYAPTDPPLSHLYDIVAKRIWRPRQRILPERQHKLNPTDIPQTVSSSFTANAVIQRPIFNKQRNLTWRGIWRPKPRAMPQRPPFFAPIPSEQTATFTADAVVHVDGTWEFAFTADAVIVPPQKTPRSNITALGIWRPKKRILPQQLKRRRPWMRTLIFEDTFTRSTDPGLGGSWSWHWYDSFFQTSDTTIASTDGSTAVFDRQPPGNTNFESYVGYPLPASGEAYFDFLVPLSNPSLGLPAYGLLFDPFNYYGIYVEHRTGTTWCLEQTNGGTGFNFTPTLGEWYTVHATWDGTRILARVWKRSDPEPTTWQLNAAQLSVPNNPLSEPPMLDVYNTSDTEDSKLDNIQIWSWESEWKGYGGFQADAWIFDPAHPVFTFTANAITRRTQSGSFTANAVIAATTTSSFTANAWIFPGFYLRTGSIRADAVITDLTHSTQFSADAVIYDPNVSGGGPQTGSDPLGTHRVVITLDGVDISANVIYHQAEFVSLTNGGVGTCKFRIKDPGHSFAPLTGKEITLTIDGRRVWGGYAHRVSKSFFFPAQDTANDELVVRGWDVEGVDYNILFSKRVIFKASNPTAKIDFTYPAGTYDDTIINDIFDNYLDLSGLGISKSGVTRVDVAILDIPGAQHEGTVASAGFTWGEMMDSIIRATGGIYYISPTKVFTYVDVDTPDTTWQLNDQPTGTWDVGYADIEILADGTNLVNDALVWGQAMGVSTTVFSRTEDATSIADHGRWQAGLFSPALYRQSNADRISSSYVYGSPQNKRGGKDDAMSFICTVYDPLFVAGQKVRCISAIYGYEDVLPIRRMEVTFPAQNAPVMKLGISHAIDLPFSLYESRWPKIGIPKFNIHIPGIVLPPDLPPGVQPGGCDCTGITDSFTRSVTDAWGTSDAGAPWIDGNLGDGPASVVDGYGRFVTTASGSTHSRSMRLSGISLPRYWSMTFDFYISDWGGTNDFIEWESFNYVVNQFAAALIYEKVVGTSRLRLFASEVSPGSVWTNINLATGTWYTMRWEMNADGWHRAKVWQTSSSEPGAWTVEQDASAQSDLSSTEFAVDFNTEEANELRFDNLNIEGINSCSENRFDNFNRSISGALGTSDVGKTWTSQSGAGYAQPFADGAMFRGDYSPTSRTSYSYQEWFGSTGPWTGNAFTMTTRVMMNPVAGTNNGDELRWEISESGGGDSVYVVWSPRAYFDGLAYLRVSAGSDVGDGTGDATPGFATFTSGVWYLLKWEYLKDNYIRAKVWAEGTTEPDWQAVGLHDPGNFNWVNADLTGDFYFIVWFEQESPGPPTVTFNQTKYMDYIDFDYDGKPCAGCLGDGSGMFSDTFTRSISSGYYPSGGWGTSDSGLVWDNHVYGNANAGVDGSVGYQIIPAGNFVGDFTYSNMDVLMPSTPTRVIYDFKFSDLPTGNNYLQHRMMLSNGSTITGGAPISVATSGGAGYSSISLWSGDVDLLPYSFWEADTWYTILWEFDVTTAIERAKIWRRSDPEPSTWNVEHIVTNVSRFQAMYQPPYYFDMHHFWNQYSYLAPITTYFDNIVADLDCSMVAGTESSSTGYICESPTDTGDQRHFQLANALVTGSSQVFVQGLRQVRGSDYTESPTAGQIVFASTLTIPEADSVYVCYTANGAHT